jgi:hypothetical protein
MEFDHDQELKISPVRPGVWRVRGVEEGSDIDAEIEADDQAQAVLKVMGARALVVARAQAVAAIKEGLGLK